MSDVAPEFREIAERMVEVTPQAKALGLQFISVAHARGVLAAPWREDLVGDPETGVIASGVVTTLLDHTCGLAMAAAAGTEPFSTATLDLRIDYMRAAKIGNTVIARATCYRMTRNVAFLRCEAHDGDPADLVAHANGTFMFTSGG